MKKRKKSLQRLKDKKIMRKMEKGRAAAVVEDDDLGDLSDAFSSCSSSGSYSE
jgi:hypothetical protein